ncbi:MAG: hypothetical protein ACMUIP_09810 [bacterium]
MFRKKVYFIMILLLFVNLVSITASKRIQATEIQADTTERIISYRKVEFDKRFFDIYINHREKFISVHGKVDDWKDLHRVEEHFKTIAPADYCVYCNIALGIVPR